MEMTSATFLYAQTGTASAVSPLQAWTQKWTKGSIAEGKALVEMRVGIGFFMKTPLYIPKIVHS